MKPKFELGQKVIVISSDINNLTFDVKLAARIASIVNIMHIKDVNNEKVIAIQYKVTTPGTILQTVNEADLYAHTAAGVKELYSNFFTDLKNLISVKFAMNKEVLDSVVNSTLVVSEEKEKATKALDKLKSTKEVKIKVNHERTKFLREQTNAEVKK